MRRNPTRAVILLAIGIMLAAVLWAAMDEDAPVAAIRSFLRNLFRAVF
jgi:hypothetical protein